MIRIGVTGTVGAGKSSVARLFEEWGAFRLSADELAREAVRPGSEALEQIRAWWGDEVMRADGSLDRAELRRRVFRNDEARRRLEAILHPRILALREKRLEEAKERGVDALVEEVPLLFEAGIADRFDRVVVVDAPIELRKRRLFEQREIDAAEFTRIDAAQWPAAKKRSAADYVIENDGTRAELEARARRVWDAIRVSESGEMVTAAGDAAADGGPPAMDGAWRLDLHMHTSASSDCLSAPGEVVRRARALKLTRIAITDHNEIAGALEAKRLDEDLVLVGEEVRTAEGLDLIGLFLTRHIPPGGAFRDVAEAIHAQGGLVYLPHPFDPRRGASEEFLDEVADCIDAVEGFNARIHDPARNRKAQRWADRHGLPVGAGSDAHLLSEIGRAIVWTRPFESPDQFLSALRAGRIDGRASSHLVHLGSTWAKIRKRLPV